MGLEEELLGSNYVNTLNKLTLDAFEFSPHIIVAAFYLVFGIIVSDFVGRLVSGVLKYLNVEKILQKYRVEDALGGTEISPMLAKAAKWYFMIMFLTLAVNELQLSSLNPMFNAVLLFAPVLIGVGLLVIVAAIIGEWIREAILDLHKFYFQKTLAEVSKWVIVILSVVVALETIGFQMGFVKEVFTTVLQGIVWGVAIAFGLAFGLGGQNDAKDMIKKTRKKFKL